MKSLRSIVTSIVLAGAALAAMPAMSGCYATTDAYIVDDTPPPPREEVVVYRPGYVWVHGRWTHPGGRWTWQSGRYERERPSQVYVEGRWERRGKRHHWVEGGWRARGGVVVREHR